MGPFLAASSGKTAEWCDSGVGGWRRRRRQERGGGGGGGGRRAKDKEAGESGEEGEEKKGVKEEGADGRF